MIDIGVPLVLYFKNFPNPNDSVATKNQKILEKILAYSRVIIQDFAQKK